MGGDIVAGMLAAGMDRDKRVRLFVDVGTNCEIVLSDGERILSTAAPAGPAFEGGAISQTQADEFMAGNLLFMMFPYIRTTVQQVSADLRLPLTVLPYLRRETGIASEDADPPD